MVYVLEHAIKQCKKRFPEITNEVIEDHLTIIAIDGLRIQHNKKKDIYAIIEGNIVLISKIKGKDEIIYTVLDRRKAREKNNWWMKYLENKSD